MIYFNKIILTLITLATLLTYTSANKSYALSLGYKTDAPYYYASGVDFDFPLIKKENCIDFTTPKFIDSGSQIQFESKVIEETSDLLTTINKNTSVSANGFWGKVKIGASFHQLDQEEKKQLDESTFFTISGKIIYGRKTSNRFTLLPEYQNLIHEGKFEEFEKRCGNYFISTEHNIAEIVALVKAKGLTQSLKKKILNQFNLNISSTGVGEVNLEHKIDKVFSELRKYSSLEVEFHTNSGEGGSSLAKLILASSHVNYDSIVKAIAEHAHTLTADNTHPYSYDLTPMSYFGFKMKESNLKRQSFLERSYLAYLDLLAQLAQIEKMEKSFGPSKNHFSNQKRRIESYLSLIERNALHCYDSYQNCNESVQKFDFISADLATNLKLSFSCQHIASNHDHTALLYSLFLGLSGEIPIPSAVDLNSINIFYEEDDALTEKDFSVNWNDYPYPSKTFSLLFRSDPFVDSRSNIQIDDSTLEKIKHLYKKEINRVYYLKISDLKNNTFIYYLGRPAGQCEITQKF